MQINMYNVQFGDCFLLCDENENLLVDFGSDNPKCDLTAISNHIKAESGEKTLSVLISHFHEDHINGFLKNSFNAENVYLPDIIAMNKSVRKLSFLQMEILADIFKWIPVRKSKKLVITLYDLLLKLCDEHSTIRFLQRGSSFYVSGREYQVLWPDFSTLAIHGRVEKKILKVLKDLGLTSDEQRIDRAPSIKGEITEQVFVNGMSHELGLPIRILDPFIDKIVESYETLANIHPSNQVFNKQQMEAAYNNLEADLNNTLDTVFEDSKVEIELLRDISELHSSLHKQANKYSVVFHDAPQNGQSSILMTGDLTSPEFNKLLDCGSPSISSQYNIIKAPHHATGTHFTPQFPLCYIIMASNGTPNKNHIAWNEISYQYGSFYQSHKNTEIICSNERCELLSLKDTPTCRNCGSKHCSYNGDSVNVVTLPML